MNKKQKAGLLPKLLLAIFSGLLIGTAAQHLGRFGALIIRLGATYNDVFSNFLSFCIPLIIIGFVAPGIADLGQGAGKTLAAATGISYLSTIVAGTLAFFVDFLLFPHLVKADMFTTHAENAELTAMKGLISIEMPPLWES